MKADVSRKISGKLLAGIRGLSYLLAKGGHSELRLRYLSDWPLNELCGSQSTELTPQCIRLIAELRHEIICSLAPQANIEDRDVLLLALEELQLALRSAEREDKVLRLRFHLSQARTK